MSEIITNHAKIRSQQRNIDVGFVLQFGEFIPQFGSEGVYFMSDKVVASYMEALKRHMKKIKDGRVSGGEKQIHLIKQEMIGIERLRGKYVAVSSEGVAKTCCYSTRRHQKALLRERKGSGRHRRRR